MEKSTDRFWQVLLVVLFVALLAKFFWTLFVYDTPLGYDLGFYRYLFVRHADGFPPFNVVELDPWARAHPLGLFFFTTILIRLGVPVDWFIGWLWNATAVAVVCFLAWVTAEREGKKIGILVLLMALLSAPYYDGFAAMYWKAYFVLFFLVLTFHLLDRHSWWAVVPGFLTLVTHHQTGLLMVLVLASWWAIQARKHWREPRWRMATIAGIAIAGIAALWYIPIWNNAIWVHIKPLLTLRGDKAPSGTFPGAMFFFRTNAVLLILGVSGWVLTLWKKRTITIWHLAVLWPAVFVFLRLFFHRRFFVQLDFFLLPFAAIAIYEAFVRWRSPIIRIGLIVLIVIQSYFTVQVMLMRKPKYDMETIHSIMTLSNSIPKDAYVIGLENVYPAWLRGWLPHHRVGGPGLFLTPWKREGWEKFIYGDHEDRLSLLEEIEEGPVYLHLTPYFFEYYQDIAERFVEDPCFEKVEGLPLLRVVCVQEEEESGG